MKTKSKKKDKYTFEEYAKTLSPDSQAWLKKMAKSKNWERDYVKRMYQQREKFNKFIAKMK